MPPCGFASSGTVDPHKWRVAGRSEWMEDRGIQQPILIAVASLMQLFLHAFRSNHGDDEHHRQDSPCGCHCTFTCSTNTNQPFLPCDSAERWHPHPFLLQFSRQESVWDPLPSFQEGKAAAGMSRKPSFVPRRTFFLLFLACEKGKKEI